MAIAAATLTASSSGVNAADYATVSVTPTANSLVLVAVTSNRTAGSPTIPTLSGNGLTYVQIATLTYRTIASPQNRISVFRAMGASPSAGVITIDYAGTTQDNCTWSVCEFAGVDTSGTNGSGAIVQSGTNPLDSQSNPAGIGVTLAAFGSADNRPYGAGSTNSSGGTAITPEGTQLAENANSSPATIMNTQWYDATADTTVFWSGAGGTLDYGFIAVEIKAAVAAGGGALDPMGMSGFFGA